MLESDQMTILYSNAMYSFKWPSPLLPCKKKNLAHTGKWSQLPVVSILKLHWLMCCFVQLTIPKSYFYEASVDKKLSSNHLLIQPMLFHSVSGKRYAPYVHYPSHSSSTFFISNFYISNNSLTAPDNKLITQPHIPVLSWACHYKLWNLPQTP